MDKFSYKPVRLRYYPYGIKQVALTKKQTVLMARPKKALYGKIVTTPGILLRSSKQVIELLVEDFRIEKQSLRDLDSAAIKKWLNSHPKKIVLKSS